MTACTNKIVVNTGDEPKSVSLPDGSLVLVNKESSIEYEERFERRQIHLQGEAYFVVKHGTDPFIVQTRHGRINVTGTEFNVSSSNTNMQVEVEEGSVELEVNNKKEKVEKGECVFYDDVKELYKKGKAEFKHHVWTDDFKDDLRAVGKEIKKSSRKIGKELKNLHREIKREIQD
jgi:ferric-dicitrate binding protein FerR (iron transport regulator)